MTTFPNGGYGFSHIGDDRPKALEPALCFYVNGNFDIISRLSTLKAQGYRFLDTHITNMPIEEFKKFFVGVVSFEEKPLTWEDVYDTGNISSYGETDENKWRAMRWVKEQVKDEQYRKVIGMLEEKVETLTKKFDQLQNHIDKVARNAALNNIMYLSSQYYDGYVRKFHSGCVDKLLTKEQHEKNPETNTHYYREPF
jgi:hypothetical protein